MPTIQRGVLAEVSLLFSPCVAGGCMVTGMEEVTRQFSAMSDTVLGEAGELVAAEDRSGTRGPRYGSQPRVAILILNWNGMRETLETLESLQRLRYRNCEIVLVDNGSTDGSREAVATAFPAVR